MLSVIWLHTDKDTGETKMNLFTRLSKADKVDNLFPKEQVLRKSNREEVYDEEIILEEKIKLLEAKLEFANQVIGAQRVELEVLRKNCSDHTGFLHSTISQLITKATDKSPVSPGVAAYLEKKNLPVPLPGADKKTT